MTQTVSLSFFRFGPLSARLWALGMMGAARFALPKIPDIGFWKLCGSGIGEGFTPVPNTAVYAILATWPDEATARERIATQPLFHRYRRRALEHWTVFLSTQSVRGEWSGQTPFEAARTPGIPPDQPRPDPMPDKPTDPAPEPGKGPVAALTRATIKPRILTRFWGRVPDISAMIGADPNVAFKIGIGEVPWLHQVTFSIWPDTATMAAFARTGPHAAAIRAVRDEGWFREELYARFAILSDTGTWNGTSPLERLRP